MREKSRIVLPISLSYCDVTSPILIINGNKIKIKGENAHKPESV